MEITKVVIRDCHKHSIKNVPFQLLVDVISLIFSSSSSPFNITSSCNVMCNCDVKYYSPVCSKEDQLTFYSPCFAGCSADDVLGDKVRILLFCFLVILLI